MAGCHNQVRHLPYTYIMFYRLEIDIIIMRKVKNKPNNYAECKGNCYGKIVTYRC